MYMRNFQRPLLWSLLLLTCAALSHDEQVGARFVQLDGANFTNDCLDHHAPCASIQHALAQAEPGNTVMVAEGIYDMSGVEPESFLFGINKAAGGYSKAAHFHEQDPDAFPTILIGVDARYKQAMNKQGFKWASDYAAAMSGNFDSATANALQATQAAAMDCAQGLAGQFPCYNVDFQSQMALNQFSTQPATMSNLWGFVDLNDNREYVVVGLRTGTAVVDISDPLAPREVATIAGNVSAWREVKVYQYFDAAASRYRAYAYVTTEAANSGIQVIDLSGLPGSISLATTLNDTSRQHTLYVANIDYATNLALPGRQAFLYVAGANLGNGSWRIYSLANPAAPQLLSTAPTGTQYMHDSTNLYITDARTAQCDQGHNPCEVLVDFNENSVDLWDVTDKSQPVRLSSTGYPNVAYTHSGWPTTDQRYLIFHDELDEIQRGLNTRIYTMHLGNLRAPSIFTSYTGSDTTTDHNGYSRGNYYYVSHYRRGLTIFDATSPTQLKVVGRFDTFLAPAENVAGTDGAWGVYPFFPSGTVAVSDISNGLFILKDRTATLSQSAGSVGFAGATISVAENAGRATVRVQRSSGSVGAVSLQYATADGSALAGSDYTATAGTLSWQAGDVSERSFVVPISNDVQDEGNETLRIVLSGITGGAVLDGAATLEITIVNDDAPPPPAGSNAGGGGGGGAMRFDALAMLMLILAVSAGRRRKAGVRVPADRGLRDVGAGPLLELRWHSLVAAGYEPR